MASNKWNKSGRTVVVSEIHVLPPITLYLDLGRKSIYSWAEIIGHVAGMAANSNYLDRKHTCSGPGHIEMAKFILKTFSFRPGVFAATGFAARLVPQKAFLKRGLKKPLPSHN